MNTPQDLLQYVRDQMVRRPVLRMDITPTSSDTNFEAEVLNYWEDTEGVCVIRVKCRRVDKVPTIQVGVLTQSFMTQRRDREILTSLQPIMAAWESKGWEARYHLFVRVAQPTNGGREVWWQQLNPLNILVIQNLVRLQTAIELTQAKPLDVATALYALPSAEHLLESELQCALRDTARKLGHVIQEANKELAGITQL